VDSRAARRFALALALLAVSGCDRSASPTATSKPASSGPSTPPDVDALRSLPYAGSVEDDDAGEAGTFLRDAAASSPGFNLYSIHTGSAAELSDAAGKVLRSWRIAPSRHWDNVDLLPSGDILVVGADPDPAVPGIVDEKRYLLRMNWAGEVVWKKYLFAHHDAEQLPDGRILTLTFTRRTIPQIHPTIETRDDNLTILTAAGEPAESMSLYDCIVKQPDIFPLGPVKPTVQGGKQWVDLFHCNSVEWMVRKELFGTHALYSPDHILVCFRHQDRVAIFNWKTRQVVWAWGQGQLGGPHDAQLLENGNILIFDNGLGRMWSRVIELDPRSNKIVWEYKAREPKSFYTASKGSCQRLANGNTLICESDSGRAFEVTPQGRIVWEFVNPQIDRRGKRGTLVRIKRYDAAFIDAIR
jgi:Arylsulfotransferase (ASST)